MRGPGPVPATSVVAGERRHGPSQPWPVTDATFVDEVLRADRPVLVDFWAPWCGPCRLVVPLLEEIAADQAGWIHVRTLNVDENPVTTAAYGILSMPTLLAFADGELVQAVVGARPRQVLRAELAAVLRPR
ncbi:thioredoxin [Cellulomonas sp. S1-8]|uniref:thioredoxin n=1 Tax=Cellulomonas sp. S1-8 TaxID=2904790 RepID=UPI002AD3EED8|nr:thioredoxin [Cellulomonas sp. S1-8]